MVNDEQEYKREIGLFKRFQKQLATAVNIPSLTTNQKVAGSSPAERALEIVKFAGETQENESPRRSRRGLLAAAEQQ
jgi:hypothetical protein